VYQEFQGLLGLLGVLQGQLLPEGLGDQLFQGLHGYLVLLKVLLGPKAKE